MPNAVGPQAEMRLAARRLAETIWNACRDNDIDVLTVPLSTAQAVAMDISRDALEGQPALLALVDYEWRDGGPLANEFALRWAGVHQHVRAVQKVGKP